MTQKKKTYLPVVPLTCTNSGCHRKARFVFIRVIDKHTSVTLAGNANKFTYRDSKGVIMKDKYFFDKWITRCFACYEKDSKRGRQ